MNGGRFPGDRASNAQIRRERQEARYVGCVKRRDPVPPPSNLVNLAIVRQRRRPAA